MAKQDSISVFAEGTFEEQISELAEYIAQSRQESEQAAFKQAVADNIKSVQKDGERDLDADGRRKVLAHLIGSVESLGDGSEREIEGFFNLLTAHLTASYDSDSAEFLSMVARLLDIIASHDATDNGAVRYRVLANIFNATARTSPARLAICNSLVKIASEGDDLSTLNLSVPSVNRWLAEWHASPQDKSEFLKSISTALEAAGQSQKALDFAIAHARTLPASESQTASLAVIASALRIPNYFDFDAVSRLESVQSMNKHELFLLLTIFTGQGLEELRGWIGGHGALLDEFHLEAQQLERKMRLLTLADLAFTRIGKSLSYAEISSSLRIEDHEVERWAIDVIREGLLAGKLSQTSKTLHILRASPRGFAMDHWTTLEKRLIAWQEGLVGIKNVLQSTRYSGSSTAVSEAVL